MVSSVSASSIIIASAGMVTYITYKVIQILILIPILITMHVLSTTMTIVAGTALVAFMFVQAALRAYYALGVVALPVVSRALPG